ncbi:ATP-binding protein [Streptomyces sp. NPDC101213]|uniref:ATP-binding protein n=1 Tax=Streptomyces sp. NPDC101213 TaxID=3366130 RepID=UPI0037FFCF4E
MHSPSSQRHRPSPGVTAATGLALSFTSTPRGARLARPFVAHRLDSWGHPHDGHVNETPALTAAELCANAVRHGRVPGRDFHVRLTAEADGGRLRVGVSDTRAEHRPAVTAARHGLRAPRRPALRVLGQVAGPLGGRHGVPGARHFAGRGGRKAPQPVMVQRCHLPL